MIHIPKLFCPFCCYGFDKRGAGEKKFIKHKLVCEQYGPQRSEVPKEGENFIKFKQFTKMMKLPFCIYGDFEVIQPKCEPNLKQTNTDKHTKHEASGFTFYTVSPYFPPNIVTYMGADAGKVFLEKILEEEERLNILMEETDKEMEMTSKDKNNFKRAIKCHICEEMFTDEDIKVRDHCHYTGIYRGAAHEKCNLLYRKVKDIPVFFHNLSGYDGHIIFQNLTKVKDIAEPQVIAKSMEKFVTFSIGNLKFKDSMNFLNLSLDKLVKNLKSSGDGVFKNLNFYFKDKWGHLPDSAFEMLTRKGVYPYSYMDSFDRFN